MTRGNNEEVFMTRRYPRLRGKVLERDSKIAKKLICAWDIERDSKKVLSIFLKEQNNLSNERYWELLRTVWILCGSLETVDIFRSLMKSGRSERHYFSTPEEAKKLRDLPGILYVYRACNVVDGIADNGISWTLSKDYAEWYKQKYCKDTILESFFNKCEVFAYINRNKEEEILILS